MPDPVLQTTLEVKVDNELYIFGIPTVSDEIKIGLRERDIRYEQARAMLGENPTMEQLSTINAAPTGDNGTDFLVRCAAIFEVLLRKSDTTWPWSPGIGGVPVVDYREWPSDRVNSAMRVGVQFQNELGSFRQKRTAAGKPNGGEAPNSGTDIGDLPIRPDAPGAHGAAA